MFGTFAGGIHPPEKKEISEGIAFETIPVPERCYVPLLQHIGAPAVPVVEVGDSVDEGQLIGEAQGLISAPVHAPVPGKVVEIIDAPTVYQTQKTIVIEMEGAFPATTGDRSAASWREMSKDDMVVKIRDAGVVGLGGAAFPTAVKLAPPPTKEIDLLVINGAECEPYLTVDDMLTRTFAEEIIEGIQITLKVLGILKAVVGIEDNKPEAVKTLQEALKKVSPEEDITVASLKTKYPQGAEKQLIYSLTKREVPSRGLPMDVGIVVQNIGTVFSIREAVLFDKPLFERYITVSGECIAKPGNYKVRIGTRISDIIEECGGLKEEPARVVVGGPMCGLNVSSMDVPVVKGTSGILFMSEREVDTDDYGPCIRCGRCVTACPVGLLPVDLGNSVEMDRMDIAAELNPYDCIMCGSCSYICPAKRPLSHFIKIAQMKLAKKQ